MIVLFSEFRYFSGYYGKRGIKSTESFPLNFPLSISMNSEFDDNREIASPITGRTQSENYQIRPVKMHYSLWLKPYDGSTALAEFGRLRIE
jgi:hypothetical protein